ncbi:hypothetical protein K438DRAFT_776767 [Mycena galopus ATCC 62051]|nr:hypothetical protein K438DRAFT_776767 [Mycena galopus ATCC 62051]
MSAAQFGSYSTYIPSRPPPRPYEPSAIAPAIRAPVQPHAAKSSSPSLPTAATWRVTPKLEPASPQSQAAVIGSNTSTSSEEFHKQMSTEKDWSTVEIVKLQELETLISVFDVCSAPYSDR